MATKLQIRENFVKTSKRFDLVTDFAASDFTDAGADRFVEAGQRFLTEEIDHRGLIRRHMTTLDTGEFEKEIVGLMRVDNIFIIGPGTDANSRVNITNNVLSGPALKTVQTKLMANWDTGKPNCWAINDHRLAPEQKAETSTSFTTAGVLDFDDIQFALEYTKFALLFYPVADKKYTIDLTGKFYEDFAVGETGTNFFMSEYPELLVLAAAYALERTYRNSAGMSDWLNAMQPALNRLLDTEIERDLSGEPSFIRG